MLSQNVHKFEFSSALAVSLSSWLRCLNPSSFRSFVHLLNH